MSSMSRKVDHVRRARQSRAHDCHWPDCERVVPPAMWGCRTHWMMLPIAREVQRWIEEHYPPPLVLDLA